MSKGDACEDKCVRFGGVPAISWWRGGRGYVCGWTAGRPAGHGKEAAERATVHHQQDIWLAGQQVGCQTSSSSTPT